MRLVRVTRTLVVNVDDIAAAEYVGVPISECAVYLRNHERVFLIRMPSERWEEIAALLIDGSGEKTPPREARGQDVEGSAAS